MRRLQVWIVLLLLATSALLASSARAAAEQECFVETGYCLEGEFLRYWRENGDVYVFGYPISSPQMETNGDGGTFMTQWFERNRFELRTDWIRPHNIALGRLGADLLARQGRDWSTEPTDGEVDGCLWFAETRQDVCGLFLEVWQTYGLEMDMVPGVSHQEAVALSGLPLSGVNMETNCDGDTVETQYFERAVYELHVVAEHSDGSKSYSFHLRRLGPELLGQQQCVQ